MEKWDVVQGWVLRGGCRETWGYRGVCVGPRENKIQKGEDTERGLRCSMGDRRWRVGGVEDAGRI